MELIVRNLTKQYGDKRAVDDVSLRLTEGINGLLGANGAGKTTLMRMLCGILRPTRGSIALDGIDVSSEDYRALLGYLPQEFGYYPDFTGLDFLLYLGALKGLSRSHARRRAEELLELVSLQDVAKKKIKTYSGGMKQRLGIAQALLNDPRLLVVDEPTAGLDPKGRVRFRNLIAELGKGSIILLSTHIVSDVEQIADHMLMLRAGQLILDAPWDKSRTDLEQLYLEEFGGAEA
ncbi:MAG: ABC transporter ATP-binding protein [Oscillospiraceae bacterium]|nr:ABC transporter ATP-binding protein [Oscillospiraceae bacterium]